MNGGRPLKIVVIGDGMVGKTCLLMTYVRKAFPEQYIPTVFENYSGSVRVGGEEVAFELWDTAGQEEYSHLRPLTYSNVDVIILCFSLIRQPSFDNVESKWLKEIKDSGDLKNKPFILVGTMSDYRAESSKLGIAPVISHDKGRRLAKSIGAVGYLECSAKLNSGVKEVFNMAIQCGLDNRVSKPSKHKCTLL
ncbi:hypothetical protein AHF37_11553 [Paragonimus kellicotti]|nr:hypothetical protein AHF37_11553 [Paragonimus kellicotti]